MPIVEMKNTFAPAIENHMPDFIFLTGLMPNFEV
jgi:hypothetical protein